MDVQHHKDALLRKRGEILGSGGIKPLQASMENNTRQGDMADQASGNNEVHIQLKLKQTDAKTGKPLDAKAAAGARTWSGRVPESADYRIDVTRVAQQGGELLPYVLVVRRR